LAVSQFLALFHAGDRERLLSAARRAHLQGEFDMEVRVAHLPLVLQCRGQTSHRAGPNADMVIVGVAKMICAKTTLPFVIRLMF